MRIHHLHCGSMCPLGGRAWDGRSAGVFAHLVCHCWLIETEAGLVLVDTGIARDRAHRANSVFRVLNRPSTEGGHCAVDQIERLGFSANDVRHILMTHLDFDHAGGLIDFPKARLHVTDAEYLEANRPDGFLNRQRYLSAQWAAVREWSRYRTAGELWFGFGAVRQLDHLPPEILFVPLAGHTMGHAGIAVQTAEGWRLHARDAYFNRLEMHEDRRPIAAGLYQRMMAHDDLQRLDNQRRLRELVSSHAGQIEVCSSHDPVELETARIRVSAGPAHVSESVVQF